MLFGASGEHPHAAAIHVRFETNSRTALSEFLLLRPSFVNQTLLFAGGAIMKLM